MKKSNNLEVKLEGDKLGYLISGLLDGEYGVRKAEGSSTVLEVYSNINRDEKELIGTVLGKIQLKKDGIVCSIYESHQKDKLERIVYWAKTLPKVV